MSASHAAPAQPRGAKRTGSKPLARKAPSAHALMMDEIDRRLAGLRTRGEEIDKRLAELRKRIG